MEVLATILTALLITQIAVFTTTIYLHRALAHHSLELHPAVEFVFRFVNWIMTGQRRDEWVAVHRKHHAYTDKEGDPHSPKIYGFWKIQLGNVFYYMREAKNPETIRRFTTGLETDWMERWVFSNGTCGVIFGLFLLMAVFGFWKGTAIGLLHFIFYVFVVAPLINGLGHWRGQQNFPGNTAYNWPALAPFTGGESLHNNHHQYPRAPKFSMRPFPEEFDPSWIVIWGMGKAGLLEVLGKTYEIDSK